MPGVLGCILGLRAIQSQVPGHPGNAGHVFALIAWASSSTRAWLDTLTSCATIAPTHFFRQDGFVAGWVFRFLFPYPAE